MRYTNRLFRFSGVLLVIFLALSACTRSSSKKITTHPDIFGTSAAQTLVPQITQAAQTPQSTATPPAVTATLTTQPSATLAPATAQPTLTATASPTTAPSTIAAAPCDRAEFVTDVSYPDGSILTPGATFVKTWRLRNNGSCTWNSSYNLVYVANNSMGAPAALPLTSGTVPPGGVIDVSVTLKAPSLPDNYEGDWKLSNSTGKLFGIGADADSPFWVRITVVSAKRIQMMSGATSAGVDGRVSKNSRTSFLAGAAANQYLMASVNGMNNPLVLEIKAPDGSFLDKASDNLSSWQGTLPANGDYLISVVNSGEATDFSLSITIPVRVSFKIGTTSASLTGKVGGQMINTYMLKALKGQKMTVTIQSDKGDVYLTIYGLQDGVPYVRSHLAQTTFSFTLTATQDYVVQAESMNSAAENYTILFEVK